MVNLKTVLAEDIVAGIAAAQEAGALSEAPSLPPVVVERAGNPEHGDYASPIALALTKKLKKPPMELVEIIVEHMPKREYVGKLEVAAPGFLNIRLNPGWLTARLDDVIEQELCDASLGQGKRVNLEFISANPTGPMTLGNMRTAFSVDTLANILACAGFSVTREYYINDAGAQVRKLGESVLRRALQAQGEDVEYPEELYQGEYVHEVAATIAEQFRETEGKEFEPSDLEDEEILQQVSELAVSLLLNAIKRTVREDLKIEMDVWASEKALREKGVVEQVIEKLRKKKVLYTKEGATYLKTTDFGDTEDRVLVKSDGEYAYIAPDIGYHQDKYDRQYDELFTFVGADHQGHAPKLMAAMQALGNDPEKLHVIAAQWMRFVQDGNPIKLSKRRGNVVEPKDLIERVGYDAARFFMVQHALTTHMDFDLTLAAEQSERNPVYYVQYAYVRLQSILRKAKEEGVIESLGMAIELRSDALLTQNAEVVLLRDLYRFPEVIAEIVGHFEPHPLAYYATDLARSVHQFYRHVPVLVEEDEQVRMSRLQLVLATRKVLGQTLDLLSLQKPDVM